MTPDPSAPKRPRGRPPSAASRTAAQRKAASRATRQAQAVELPGAVLDALDALSQRHGDPSRAATVARLVLEAAR